MFTGLFISMIDALLGKLLESYVFTPLAKYFSKEFGSYLRRQLLAFLGVRFMRTA